MRFLRGIEKTLQTRWQSNAIPESLSVISLPILRLPVPPNPNPKPFKPDLITGLFSEVLNGELLVSFWRIEPAGGVNVKKLFTDPPVVDIVDWIQGAGLVPYLEPGPILTENSLRQFQSILSGRALMFSILLN